MLSQLFVSFVLVLVVAAQSITGPCNQGSIIFEDGANVPSVDPCQKCRCYHGTILCDYILCIQVVCNENQRLVKSPGQCCKKCVP